MLFKYFLKGEHEKNIYSKFRDERKENSDEKWDDFGSGLGQSLSLAPTREMFLWGKYKVEALSM